MGAASRQHVRERRDDRGSSIRSELEAEPQGPFWFEGFIENHCEVLPVTPVIAIRQLRGQLQAMGQVRRQADMLIAATASVHALMVVTRNVNDFEGCGVSVFNPFSP
jgi:toxin FitB